MSKPSGVVSSIDVVVALSFSVGTASVNTWSCCASTTGGLTFACAHAVLLNTSAASATSAPSAMRCLMEVLSLEWPDQMPTASGGPRGAAALQTGCSGA